MIPILVSFFTFISTLLGGWFAIRHQKSLHLILGLTAGVILGVVAFDILPELFELVEELAVDPLWPMLALVSGFLGFHIMEKLVLMHHEHEHQYGAHKHPKVGFYSALALCGHSFLDGVGIGLAFQVNSGVGVAVAIAIIAHKFADGLNTAGIMLAHQNTAQKAFAMVLLNAILPIAGVVTTFFFDIPGWAVILYLGFFAGFMLYICAGDILPQAHEKHSSRKAIGLTLLGVLFMLGVTQIAHI